MILFFKRHGWLFIIFTLLCMSTLHLIEFEYFSIYNATFRYLIEAILWMILIFSYMHIQLPIGKHTNMILCSLGNRSYSIYLLHLILGKELLKIHNFSSFGVLFNTTLNVFSVFLVTLIVSDISYRFIERPFMAMRIPYLK